MADAESSRAATQPEAKLGLADMLQNARKSFNRNLQPFTVSVQQAFNTPTDAELSHHDSSDSESLDAASLEGAADDAARSTAAATRRKPALADRVKQLASRKLKPQEVLMRDKIGFFLGVVNLCLTAYWAGASPQTLFKWYTLKAVFLYGARFYLYRAKNWHYYMLEFCYFANVLLLLEVWVFPRSPAFHKIVFAMVAGPLTWSIVALRNSLVLHSLDKITSLFMHISPAIVCWTWKWYPDQSRLKFNEMTAEQQKAYNTATWWDFGVLAMGAYMIWVAAYYLKVFVLSERKIKEKGYNTLFTYMTKNKKTLFARCVLSVPEQFQPLVYMGIHVFLCFLATLTAKFWWESKTAHTVFLILCASGSAWNGATYYFDVFSRKYIQSLDLQSDKEVKKA